ncbi:MAG: LysR family transcriptional regulator, low CO2-responsive transcriptional regulator [Actinomycetota bacterium]|nr:LysR family transcriptional regulator, low CO2-responsive transcriptional regulator [Actinomycetota bacterium]MEA2592502.1 LysR family transcriptional regulator, low CO2-responsive transcriptional regulator [Actinomycetota bacterium]
MNLDQLQTFLLLARCGSFTRAAAELHLSQPAVSRHIQKLERELGVTLLTRRRGRVELSPAGERVRSYAEEVVGGHVRLLADLAEQPSRLAGELRIVASTTPGEFLVPGLVSAFTTSHPRVSPRIQIADSTEVVAQLRSRNADVGFSGVKLPGRDLVHRPIATDEIVLAVPPLHPFASRTSVELSELAGQPFLTRESGSGTHLSFLALLAEHGLEVPPYRSVMVLSNTAAIVSAVGNGYGIGFVSCLALRGRGPEGPVAVRIAGLTLTRSLYLVVEKDRPLPPPAASFAGWVPSQQTPGCT